MGGVGAMDSSPMRRMAHCEASSPWRSSYVRRKPRQPTRVESSSGGPSFQSQLNRVAVNSVRSWNLARLRRPHQVRYAVFVRGSASHPAAVVRLPHEKLSDLGADVVPSVAAPRSVAVRSRESWRHSRRGQAPVGSHSRPNSRHSASSVETRMSIPRLMLRMALSWPTAVRDTSRPEPATGQSRQDGIG